MTALYIALSLGLDEPKWSLMTVYIVAQPLGGMAVAKGFIACSGLWVGPWWRWAWWPGSIPSQRCSSWRWCCGSDVHLLRQPAA
ncbi:hypothetical protein HML84_03690 [Alcanivorax sp. IO_7]|nr:hypothetical protein HML84_03690 [Alcanivorax sp. IO_7]